MARVPPCVHARCVPDTIGPVVVVVVSLIVCVQVAGEVNIKTIFRREPQEATAVIIEAKKVLDSWHSTYLEVRDKIEQNLTDHRWEFDKKVRAEGKGC